MRKTAAYIIMIVSATMLVVCAVDDFTKAVSNLRKTPEALKTWWGSDKYKYGDLYGFTYLPQFRVAEPEGSEYVLPNPTCDTNLRLYNIYGLSDSYTFNVFKTRHSFCGADKIGFAASNFRDELPLLMDHSKKNILVIETVERNVRSLLADTAYVARFIHPIEENESTENLRTAEKRRRFRFDFKVNDREANYEFNIWDYHFFTPLKELRAKVNYDVFGRVNPDVVVSPDGEFLLLNTTVDTAFNESSYRPIEDKEVDYIVEGLNNAFEKYKNAGFDEIYLSIMPNPATILYPQYKQFAYNNLIPKIQNHPNLKLKVFDCYGLFKSQPNKAKLYRTSDTHWTSVGRDLWLNSFNAVLEKVIHR